MKGKVYLANLRNYREFHCDVNFMITLSNRGLHGNLIHVPNLGPSATLFQDLKSSETEEERNMHMQRFKAYKNRPVVKAIIFDMRRLLDMGKDICLICFCEDVTRCHRSIVGSWFEELGYVVFYH